MISEVQAYMNQADILENNRRRSSYEQSSCVCVHTPDTKELPGLHYPITVINYPSIVKNEFQHRHSSFSCAKISAVKPTAK